MSEAPDAVPGVNRPNIAPLDIIPVIIGIVKAYEMAPTGDGVFLLTFSEAHSYCVRWLLCDFTILILDEGMIRVVFAGSTGRRSVADTVTRDGRVWS